MATSYFGVVWKISCLRVDVAGIDVTAPMVSAAGVDRPRQQRQATVNRVFPESSGQICVRFITSILSDRFQSQSWSIFDSPQKSKIFCRFWLP